MLSYVCCFIVFFCCLSSPHVHANYPCLRTPLSATYRAPIHTHTLVYFPSIPSPCQRRLGVSQYRAVRQTCRYVLLSVASQRRPRCTPVAKHPKIVRIHFYMKFIPCHVHVLMVATYLEPCRPQHVRCVASTLPQTVPQYFPDNHIHSVVTCDRYLSHSVYLNA